MTFTHKTLPLSFLIAIGFPILLMAQADRIENLAVAHVAACREPAQAALRAWVPEGQQHIGILAMPVGKQAELGSAYNAFMVRLDDLSHYNGKEDPTALLNDTKEVTFLVNVPTEKELAHIALTMRNDGQQWQTVSFGAPHLADRVATLTKSRGPGGKLGATFFVQIPALNLVFLGERRGKQLVLTPLSSDPRFDFKQGEPIGADKVFLKLVPTAQKHSHRPG